MPRQKYNALLVIETKQSTRLTVKRTKLGPDEDTLLL